MTDAGAYRPASLFSSNTQVKRTVPMYTNATSAGRQPRPAAVVGISIAKHDSAAFALVAGLAGSQRQIYEGGFALAEIIDFASRAQTPASSGPGWQTSGTASAPSAQTQVLPGEKEAHTAQGLPMTVTLAPEGSLVYARVQVPAAAVDAAIEAATLDLLRQLGVDVRDDASVASLKNRVGEDRLQTAAVQVAHVELMRAATEALGFVPFATPTVEDGGPLMQGEDLSFTLKALVEPQVSLSSYEPVRFDFPDKPAVGSADVSAYLDNMAQELATLQPVLTRMQPQDGDIVTLQLKPLDLPEGVDSAAAQPQTINYELGSAQLGADFDQQLAGMRVGAHKDIELEAVIAGAEAGDPATSRVKTQVSLLQIAELKPAVINDAWVMSNMPQAQTLLGLRQDITRVLEQEQQAQYRVQLLELAKRELAARVQGSVDEIYFQEKYQQIRDAYAQGLAAQGIALQDDFAATEPGQEGPLITDIKNLARQEVLSDLALDALARHLGITADDQRVKQLLDSALRPRSSRSLGAAADVQDLQGSSAAPSGLLGVGAAGAAPGAGAGAASGSQSSPAMQAYAIRAVAGEWLVDHAQDSKPHLELL